jgi:hypothetical protein
VYADLVTSSFNLLWLWFRIINSNFITY